MKPQNTFFYTTVKIPIDIMNHWMYINMKMMYKYTFCEVDNEKESICGWTIRNDRIKDT